MNKTIRIAVAVLGLVLLACNLAQAAELELPAEYSLVLVRHAEKASGGFDPELTETGQARARFFAQWVSGPDIQAIWSSEFRRTLDTVCPLADRLGLEIGRYDPGRQQLLLRKLREQQLNAFVVGHSNTIPQLAAMLCECHVEPMNDSEYERAFLLKITEGQTTLSEVDLAELWKNR